MAIVTLRELMARMGDPDWTPEVRQDGQRLLATLTATLAGRLDTYIEPGAERHERAAVSERGMVVTDHPVFEVLRIDGVPAVRLPSDDDDDDPDPDEPALAVPPGWRLQDHRVFRANVGGAVSGTFPSPAVYATTTVDTGGLAGMLGGPFGPGRLFGGDGAGLQVPQVTIVYRPGWGRAEALRGAVITKASAIMIDRHDDTITARQLEGQRPPAPLTENWSADEIAALATYRSIAGPEWSRW